MPYDGDAPSDRLRPKWLVLAIVAAVATVVVAGLVGWPMLENHRYNSATVWKKMFMLLLILANRNAAVSSCFLAIIRHFFL